MRAKDRVRLALTELLSEGRRDAATIAAHFAPGYRQFVDGETLDFDGFVAHMQALDAAVETIAVTFETLVEEGDQVASRHLVESVGKDGHRGVFEVIAIFAVGPDGIRSCHELTRQITGRAQDRDLGSRRS